MKKVEQNNKEAIDINKSLELITKKLLEIENTTKKQNENIKNHETVYYPSPNNDKCCCFEIILYRARVIKDQGGAGSTEPADGGIVNENMEMIFSVTADGFNGIYPGITSYVTMSEKSGWHICNQKIAIVRGDQNIPITASAREVEVSPNPAVVALEGRAEYGTSDTAYMNLRCDCPTVPLQFDIKLSGGSINKRGIVMVEVIAKKVCCPC